MDRGTADSSTGWPDILKVHDITLSVILAGCNGIVQLLDISINHSFKDILKEIIDEKEIQWETIPEKDRPSESKVDPWRVMISWAVGEAWEQFCLSQKEVIRCSFTTVGLSLPIDGSCDSEISLKGINMGQPELVENLRVWTVGGLEQPMLDIDSDGEESLPDDDDNNSESISYEAGPPRLEQHGTEAIA
ncbi:hypothetical protein L873DRAFT_1846912 [Choiromyces venosus 120613-1]|uniref:Uncharacterized protein n=1 Tax=Choiromyces venosus 120613-1 TaxID=1336337 RepID=A0A3N4J6E3_9PEZI|nr:hypothetical protein L873DRAFT_1846912 [Choiromyces venosus 120613-1]